MNFVRMSMAPICMREACEQDVELMEKLLSCCTYQDFYEELGKM